MEKTKESLRFHAGEHIEAGNLKYYKLSVNFYSVMLTFKNYSVLVHWLHFNYPERLGEWIYGCWRGRMVRIVREFGMDMSHCYVLNWKPTRLLKYSTWNFSVLCGRLDGRGVWGEEWIPEVYYGWSLFVVHLKLSQNC